MSTLPELMPIERLHDKEVNANRLAGQEYINTREDIQEHGIQNKLKIIPMDIYHGDENAPHDEYIIEDGSQRYKIAKELGIPAVPYEIVNRTRLESLTLNYRHQANRGDEDPFEEADLFQLVMQEEGLTQQETVKELKLSSRQYLTDRLDLLKVVPKVREITRDLEQALRDKLTEKYDNLQGVVEDLEERISEEAREFAARQRVAKFSRLTYTSNNCLRLTEDGKT